ncbi:hypothetical protein [Streptomyces sp. AC512_CC834]|uniref:hypothetical protein n=1 Tax=Streptomyces sp. AC512_CC834 TaxID=2823691 RepID=UPI001C280765|nr:hypothetical protein [Streptomyces sp. AC512_CC834]
MAGTMNKACVPFRPLLTEHLLLGTPLPEELSQHVDQCPDCAREAAEAEDVVRTMRRVDPFADWTGARTPATRTRPSSDLGDRIRRIVADPKPAARPPRYRRRIALGVSAAFVTAAAVVVPLTLDQDQPPATTAAVVLARDGRMVERPGGTEVPVVLSGLKKGQTYRMMTVNAEGTRMPGGSVRADSDADVSTRMMTAMRRDTITALLVEDESGNVVTHIIVPPPSPSASRPA